MSTVTGGKTAHAQSAEQQRLDEDDLRRKHWKRWGPYVSERAWGTVREDYSPYGTAWESVPHDHARSKAYRWNEDGLAGICDRHQFLCFALALWNGRDPILKERLFGLTGHEGNHGEDRKGVLLLSRLDADPFLHEVSVQISSGGISLRAIGRRKPHARTGHDPEYELIDTGIFDDNRYFDVFVEYAKAAPEDLLHPDPGHQPRPGSRRNYAAAHDLVSQYLVVGAR